MRRGFWHQLGHNSQTLVEEQLLSSNGVGVIVSPRDLTQQNAEKYCSRYGDLGAEIMFDPQFYEPGYQNSKLASYELQDFRKSVSQLSKLGDAALDELARKLGAIGKSLGVSAVVAPAVILEPGREDLLDLNVRLFSAARKASEAIGVPVYASIVIGKAGTRSTAAAEALLSHSTAVSADGWYAVFELEDERIPSDPSWVQRWCELGLALAGTGRPLLHAYAGLTGLLSLSFGADAVASGHSHNLRHFTPERWAEPAGQGGRGAQAARYLSEQLWGTLVHPDETVRLGKIWPLVEVASQHGPASASSPWSVHDASKHFVYLLGRSLQRISDQTSARQNAKAAIERLRLAAHLHKQIAGAGISVKDGSDKYQACWANVLSELLVSKSGDYDYLAAIGK